MAHRSRLDVALVLLVVTLTAALMQRPLAAQVPPGQGVRMAATYGLPAGAGGVAIVDPVTGSITPVVDLSADAKQAFAGLIDPSNGRLVLGGGGPPSAAGKIRTVRLTGAVVTGETVLTDIGPDVQDLALDRDGNYVALDGVRLLVVSRQTGQITTIDTDQYPGTPLALAVDPETNRCWVATSTGTAFEDNVLLEYDLDNGPGPGSVLASLQFDNHLALPEGLAYDGQDGVYICGADFFSAPSLVRYSLSSGSITTAAPFVAGTAIAGVHVDLRNGHVHWAERAPTLLSAKWGVIDPAVGAANPVASFPPTQEYARANDVNDWIDRTTLYPRHASASTSTLIEMAAHGLPGELGYLAVIEVNGAPIAPLIVGAGSMNSGGYFSLAATVPPGLLPAGLSFTILSARKNLTTGHFTLGTTAELSVGP